MANEYVNKVVLSTGETLIDISADTVDAAHLLYNKTAHDKSGAPITGTCTYDADTSDATASASEILATKTAYVNGVKITGSMTNNGGVTGTISTKDAQYTIPQGFHDGSGKVSIASAEQAKIIASNIKSGVSILGVTGSYSGEAVTAQSKNATPTFSAQTILPDTGYDYLSQVNIAAIPVTRTDNASGGVTVTIG
ncbi:MAG: hypothetical protein J6U54_05435 [Clostridiales bacterium]|nr:hypothetical protein [Clostridiales bacterium]